MKRTALLLLLCPLAWAYGLEGRVTFLSGKADVKSAGKTSELKLGATVKEGDVVSTAANSKLGMQMSDGSSFLMSQRATLEIKTGSNYYQTDGAISMIFRKGGRDGGGKWAIKTPVVTAGVRGTGFTVEVMKGSARIVLFEGKVIMTDFIRETGLSKDPNLMMQDFLNDLEMNAGTAMKYDGADVVKEKIDMQKEPMKKLHDEHQEAEKSESWKKAAQSVK